MKRRHFLLQGGTVIAAHLVPGISFATGFYPSIRAALAADGFSISTPGAALLAVVADLHINLNAGAAKTSTFDDQLVAEINGLSPLPTDLVIAGDLVMSMSNAVGELRYANAHANAEGEMSLARDEVQRFRPEIQTWIVPGNHDTDNLENMQERGPELWCRYFDRPAYQRTTMGGVPVFFLNSGHAGQLDPAQEAWLVSQAAMISKDQEVLVVAHHPSLFYLVGETGLKRSLAKAFAGWTAPVFVIGGHGHQFVDEAFVNNGTRFIQMEVTAGSSKVWSEGAAPGYAVIGMSNGRVLSRVFRSVKLDRTDARPTAGQMPTKPLPWPFERVPYPGKLIETHGVREGLEGFVGSDVRDHFVYVESMAWSFPMADYRGKAREFLLLASVAESVRPTVTVSFSDMGPSGPWTTVPLPPHDGGYVHRVPLPETMRMARRLWVGFSTTMLRYGAGIGVSGWGIGSSADALTGYERWIAGRYRTFVNNAKTAPSTVPPGETRTNLELSSFNLAPVAVGPWEQQSHGQDGGSGQKVLSGGLVFSREVYKTADFEFPRRVLGADSGLRYEVQSSEDLRNWLTEDPAKLTTTPLSDGWETVRIRRIVWSGRGCYFRIGVAKEGATGADFARWVEINAVLSGTADDRNANATADVLDFALGNGPDFRVTKSPSDGVLRALPARRLTRQSVTLATLRYTRMVASARPGVNYVLERSANLSTWQEVLLTQVAERVYRSSGEWESVQVAVLDSAGGQSFFRIRLECIES
ncbi:MAG: metallophosphoesterase [Verrucomicrobia bacterium]|nr:metallophosphoesterase [Verrucomicrobiota bacterium]